MRGESLVANKCPGKITASRTDPGPRQNTVGIQKGPDLKVYPNIILNTTTKSFL